MDAALSRVKSTTDALFQFWNDTAEGCELLIKEVEANSTGLTTADARRIASNWEGYQIAIENAIFSVTKTSDAILIEGAPNPTLSRRAPVAITAARRSKFGLGSFTGLLRWFQQCI